MKSVYCRLFLCLGLITSPLVAIVYSDKALARFTLSDVRTLLERAIKTNDTQLIAQLKTRLAQLEQAEGIVIKGVNKDDIFIRDAQGKVKSLEGQELQVAKANLAPLPASVQAPSAPPQGFSKDDGSWKWLKKGEKVVWVADKAGAVETTSDKAGNEVVAQFKPGMSAPVPSPDTKTIAELHEKIKTLESDLALAKAHKPGEVVAISPVGKPVGLSPVEQQAVQARVVAWRGDPRPLPEGFMQDDGFWGWDPVVKQAVWVLSKPGEFAGRAFKPTGVAVPVQIAQSISQVETQLKAQVHQLENQLTMAQVGQQESQDLKAKIAELEAQLSQLKAQPAVVGEPVVQAPAEPAAAQGIPEAPAIGDVPEAPAFDIPEAPPMAEEGVPEAPAFDIPAAPEAPAFEPQGAPQVIDPVQVAKPKPAQDLPALSAEQLVALTPEQKNASDKAFIDIFSKLVMRYPEKLTMIDYVNSIKGSGAAGKATGLEQLKQNQLFFKRDELLKLIKKKGLLDGLSGSKQAEGLGDICGQAPNFNAVDVFKDDKEALKAAIEQVKECCLKIFKTCLFSQGDANFIDAVDVFVTIMMGLGRKEVDNPNKLEKISSNELVMVSVCPDQAGVASLTPPMLVKRLQELLMNPNFLRFKNLMKNPLTDQEQQAKGMKLLGSTHAIEFLSTKNLTKPGNRAPIAQAIQRDLVFELNKDDVARLEECLKNILEAGAAVKEEASANVGAFDINEFIAKQLPTIKTVSAFGKMIEALAGKVGAGAAKTMLTSFAALIKGAPDELVASPMYLMLINGQNIKDLRDLIEQERVRIAQDASVDPLFKKWISDLKALLDGSEDTWGILQNVSSDTIGRMRQVGKDLIKQAQTQLIILGILRPIIQEVRKAKVAGQVTDRSGLVVNRMQKDRKTRITSKSETARNIHKQTTGYDVAPVEYLVKTIKDMHRTPDSLYTSFNKIFMAALGSMENIKITKDDFIAMFQDYTLLLKVLESAKDYNELYESLRALNTAQVPAGGSYVEGVEGGARSGRWQAKLKDAVVALEAKDSEAFSKAINDFVGQAEVGIEEKRGFKKILKHSLDILQSDFLRALIKNLIDLNSGNALNVPGLEAEGQNSKRNRVFLGKLQGALQGLIKLVSVKDIKDFNIEQYVKAVYALYKTEGAVTRILETMDAQLFLETQRAFEEWQMGLSLLTYLIDSGVQLQKVNLAQKGTKILSVDELSESLGKRFQDAERFEYSKQFMQPLITWSSIGYSSSKDTLEKLTSNALQELEARANLMKSANIRFDQLMKKKASLEDQRKLVQLMYGILNPYGVKVTQNDIYAIRSPRREREQEAQQQEQQEAQQQAPIVSPPISEIRPPALVPAAVPVVPIQVPIQPQARAGEQEARNRLAIIRSELANKNAELDRIKLKGDDPNFISKMEALEKKIVELGEEEDALEDALKKRWGFQ